MIELFLPVPIQKKGTTMVSNYQLIRDENEKEYGTGIKRIGQKLLAEQYSNRTHFIFELLQNAEDALRCQRDDWEGCREVSFSLNKGVLTFFHFGRPFDESDVRSICGILESNKDEYLIGRFGIGFKSVYAFTDNPEIHSGNENFEIRKYVHPYGIDKIECDSEKTLFVFPLKAEDITAENEIIQGFKKIGPRSLLFLHFIEEINWSGPDDCSGVYLRSKPEPLEPNVRQVELIGQESEQEEIDERWLVFDRPVYYPKNNEKETRSVEIAFLLRIDKSCPNIRYIKPISESPLIVFFPTVVETHLGFLIQGPYETTPSRDNIREDDSWNRHLVNETAELLVDVLKWLKDQSMLDIQVLNCLPLDRSRFSEGKMFTPLFNAVRDALLNEALLPKSGGGYIAASRTILGETKEIRELFGPTQIKKLFSRDIDGWLSEDVTQEPKLRRYLMQELEVTETTFSKIIARLNISFFKEQSDNWILKFYEFLNNYNLRSRVTINNKTNYLYNLLEEIPLIRLDNGSHVTARDKDGNAQVFLPDMDIFGIGFPTVKASVLATETATKFLKSFDISKPDLVDDVIKNVLSVYKQKKSSKDTSIYSDNIARILAAYESNLQSEQHEKLIQALQDTPFVIALDAGNCKRYMEYPENLYMATDRMKKLFSGVTNVKIVDDSFECLCGDKIQKLLEDCGVLSYPRPINVYNTLNDSECRHIRVEFGHNGNSVADDEVQDWHLQGFKEMIKVLQNLEPEERIIRAKLIWESLIDLVRYDCNKFDDGLYSWTYGRKWYKEIFYPTSFVDYLNKNTWVPDENGILRRPDQMIFKDLGWKHNPFLLTKIIFRHSINVKLAKDIGMEPEALDWLIKQDLTTLSSMKSRFKPTNFVKKNKIKNRSNDSKNKNFHTGNGATGRRRNYYKSKGKRLFISYMGLHPDDEEHGSDGLNKQERMELESSAIEKIIELEPCLQQTPPGNEGFDLYEEDAEGNVIRWIEVKSMTGSLRNHPVGISSAQFKFALENSESFWIYIVEYASESKSRIIRIRNPLKHVRTFSLDYGWISFADSIDVFRKPVA